MAILKHIKSRNANYSDAIDYLLNAYYYFSASGPVRNEKGNSRGTSVRCIRDAFDTQK